MGSTAIAMAFCVVMLRFPFFHPVMECLTVEESYHEPLTNCQHF
jgi:hypothetical protein